MSVELKSKLKLNLDFKHKKTWDKKSWDKRNRRPNTPLIRNEKKIMIYEV